MGASVFVLPVVQRLQSLGLSSRRIHVEIQGAVSKQGIRSDLQGVAIVKVGGTEDAIRAAAQRFLNQQNEIEEFTREVLAGALRSIVGRLTIEEIIRDRTAFASAVAEEAEHSMTNQGLVLDTFQLQDILAEGTYLQDLGRPEAARVLKDAAIAEARPGRRPSRRGCSPRSRSPRRNRNLALKQAGIQAEIDAAKAKSAAAGPLAEAERQQVILAEQQKVAERTPSSRSASSTPRCASRPTPSGTGWSRRPRRPRTPPSCEADAQRQATIAAAQASAEQSRLTGEGERARRAALAEATEREGAAEASAILAKGDGRGGRHAEPGRRLRRVRRGGPARPAAAGAARGGGGRGRADRRTSTSSPSCPPTAPRR